jgi:hypothetical protein
MKEQEKQSIEHQIERARDGVSDRIDELDARLRHHLDFKSKASRHAEGLVAGGAVVGFLIGFGFPKAVMRLVQVGVPLALFAYKVQQSRNST